MPTARFHCERASEARPCLAERHRRQPKDPRQERWATEHLNYIGFAPQQKLGIVILVNRGKQHATGIGRQILHALAQEQSELSSEGEADPDSD